MHPGSQTLPDDTAFVIFLVIGFLIAGIIYVAPSIVAFRRDHPNRWPILLINVVFGGTILGWGIALVWALQAVHRLGSRAAAASQG